MASSSSSVTPEVARLYRVHKTVLELLFDRGYLVPRDHLEMSIDDFRNKFEREGRVVKGADGLQPSYIRKATDVVIVFFGQKNRPNTADVQGMIATMKHHSVPRGILIVKDGIIPQAKTNLTIDPLHYIELFKESELLFNITRHKLVPKHVLLTTEEKQELLQLHKLQETQLPRMLVTDPISRYYGLDRGDVVQIQRASETAGTYITYRVVI